MTFDQQWIEYDYNPFVLFSSNGKIVSLNAEAQFLLGTAKRSELFELATSYANKNYGFKTTFVNLEFGRYKFFGLTVGYENDEQIGVKFYQRPSINLNKPKPSGELTNIYTLVDLCISTNSINTNVKYIKDFDPTIPDLVINANEFIKLLNKIYSCCVDNEVITTKIYFRVGEHIKFEEAKYSLCSVEIKADNMQKINEFKVFAETSSFMIDIRDSIVINIPMVLS